MKFKVGDKVIIVNPHGFKTKYKGKICTIEHMSYNCKGWVMKEEETVPFYFTEDELKLAEEVTITIDPSDRAGAHKAVEDAIAEYKKKKAEWTEDELAQARELFKELIAEWCLDNHRDYIFYVNREKTKCSMYSVFNVKKVSLIDGYKISETKISGNDVFDETIGKVILLCKALKKPIPDFIKNKNT